MQSTALQFSLPTFDELRMTASRPRHIGEGKTRIMNVIAAVPALNLLKVAAYCRYVSSHIMPAFPRIMRIRRRLLRPSRRILTH